MMEALEADNKTQIPVTEEILEPPQDETEFKFPFTPYPIQKDFMKALFSALEGRKLGIFESPTGTVRINSYLLLFSNILSRF